MYFMWYPFVTLVRCVAFLYYIPYYNDARNRAISTDEQTATIKLIQMVRVIQEAFETRGFGSQSPSQAGGLIRVGFPINGLRSTIERTVIGDASTDVIASRGHRLARRRAR